jgi:PIN domain nuclease of toxin-antitoxin system
MKKVLDASALMALLFGEPGCEVLTLEFLKDSVISTVNLTEVQSTLVSRGVPLEEAWQEASGYISRTEPFTANHAKLAASLVAQTHSHGLSLGDRACLALGISLNAPVYTTDQAWQNLRVGCEIYLIR